MEREERKNSGTGVPQKMRVVFGIFMIVFYVTIGVLILLGIFNFYGNWQWLRWVAGIILVVYGLWRGYRQFSWRDSDE